jgi:hypothetical protein
VIGAARKGDLQRATLTFPYDKRRDVQEGKVANKQRPDVTFRKMPLRHLLKKFADVVVNDPS